MSLRNKAKFIDYSSLMVLALAVLVPLAVGMAAA
jgi:hypothetical protein